MGALGQAARGGELLDGRFRVDHVLGEGGYGIVYAAVDVASGARVALKVLRAAWDTTPAGTSAVARFAREAGLAARLEHPNTVRVLGFGTLASGFPYIAYEQLAGTSLDRALAARGPMTPQQAKIIARQVLSALSEAHGLGIVHRDIKPANVFLSVDGSGREVVKLLDFGVAAARFAPEGQSLTLEGMSIGTPAYMAPEQVYGTHVDARTDVYAVGLLVAEMLTGQPVFTGRNSMQIAMEQVSPRPAPIPDEVAQGELGPIVAVATEKDASRRYASAFEMMRELDLARTGRSGGVRSAEAFAATSASNTPNPLAGPTPVTWPAGDVRGFAPTALAPSLPNPERNETRDGVALVPRAHGPVNPRPRRAILVGVAATVAAGAVGSAVTYLSMHEGTGKGRSSSGKNDVGIDDESEESSDSDETDEAFARLEEQARAWERVAEGLDGLSISPADVPRSDFDLDGFALEGIKGRTLLERMASAGWKQLGVVGWPTIASYSFYDDKGRRAQLTLSTAGATVPPAFRAKDSVVVSVIVTDSRGTDEPASRSLLATLMRK